MTGRMKITIKVFDRGRVIRTNREFSTVMGALKCAVTERYDSVAIFQVMEDGSHRIIRDSIIYIPEYYRSIKHYPF